MLIGDAAHAMPPHMGQGAGLALEDAIILAREIAANHRNWSHAFASYKTNERSALIASNGRSRATPGYFVSQAASDGQSYVPFSG